MDAAIHSIRYTFLTHVTDSGSGGEEKSINSRFYSHSRFVGICLNIQIPICSRLLAWRAMYGEQIVPIGR